jgi:hypothetical protein
MQTLQSNGLSLADIPMGFFPEDAVEAPALTRPAATLAPFADAQPAKAAAPAASRALKIARAKSGETELRLLTETDGDNAVRYVIASSTIAPYLVKREVLVKPGKKKTPLNEQQAVEEFERRVALAYPPETLSNNKTVAIHLNLI